MAVGRARLTVGHARGRAGARAATMGEWQSLAVTISASATRCGPVWSVTRTSSRSAAIRSTAPRGAGSGATGTRSGGRQRHRGSGDQHPHCPDGVVDVGEGAIESLNRVSGTDRREFGGAARIRSDMSESACFGAWERDPGDFRPVRNLKQTNDSRVVMIDLCRVGLSRHISRCELFSCSCSCSSSCSTASMPSEFVTNSAAKLITQCGIEPGDVDHSLS